MPQPCLWFHDGTEWLLTLQPWERQQWHKDLGIQAAGFVGAIRKRNQTGQRSQYCRNKGSVETTLSPLIF